jgi:3-isopropylmalate/(R)-2-methylmalate dehydratase small subunit
VTARHVAFASPVVVLPMDNIDTDQIVPARFLKTLSKDGLGAQLFYDWRYESDGRPRPDFALNRPEAQSASVLVAGENFGCGSSREHAAWALTQFGIRAVVSRSFADIFTQNALKNGLLPIVVPADVHTTLLSSPGTMVTVDLSSLTLTMPDRVVPFAIDPFARQCLLEGVDELGYILQQDAAIAAYEARRPPSFDTRS